MEPAQIVIATCLAVLAGAHSALGEAQILRPLFDAAWTKPGPRWAMERLLRFAWHITSVAWLAMAAAVLGLSLPIAIAGMALVSAAMIFVMLRGHLAWPLFALAGFAGLHLEGLLARPLLGGAVLVAAITCIAVAGLHFYWALGGRWGSSVAIPTMAENAPAFRPPAWLTAAVGVALLVLAGLTSSVFLGGAPYFARWLLTAALALLVLRAVGDGRQVGFSKRDHASAFARWDDRLFTPLVVLLAFGAGAALVAG
ncbi:DUF3995 domain-containing protein [Enhygromyxa salina]|uniref:Uncharacterized protein n=1 Tax=Enhygromyxa salina TaxID=215803 RepID=A0A2S9YJ52_9BACT|nr:DUF3995 domain-containing protein [Enhygromyxa salina]PRQ05066.1 hypothetical protein ENSA7_48190 [Enhygromyxa salina]